MNLASSQKLSSQRNIHHPVNNARNNTLYLAYEELAKKTENVIFGGRLGQYKYYDMDKVILAALEAVQLEFGD